MRIERKGSAKALTPRIERFLKETLAGQEMDEIQQAEEMRADYSCLNGLLAVEIKTLKEEPSERIENAVNELRQRDDWPMFLGSAPLMSFVKHLKDPDQARLRILDRLGRAVVSHLRKANKQLGAHEETFPRKNLVRIMILINEDHEEYEPSVVGYILHHAIKRKNGSSPLYPNVDSVLYFTERHAIPIQGNISFPVLSVESMNVHHEPWRESVIEHVLNKWASWSGTPLFHSDFVDQSFVTIDQIPKMAPQYVRWQIAYKRRRYMEHWPDDQLRERFDELACLGKLAFTKSSPYKPNDDIIRSMMAWMSHMTLEMGWRAIPLTDFQHTPERLSEAGRRLGLNDEIIHWLEND